MKPKRMPTVVAVGVSTISQPTRTNPLSGVALSIRAMRCLERTM
jgi:hypothetical protein